MDDIKHTPLQVERSKIPDSESAKLDTSSGRIGHLCKIVFSALFLVLLYILNCAQYTMHVSAADLNDLRRHNQTIFIPYIVEFSSQQTPRVKATVGGVDVELPVDTGSTGLLIGAPRLPNVRPDEGVPAHEYFSSSNILYNGRLVDLAVTFHGNGSSRVTTKVPVLVVDKSVVCPWYDPERDTFDCPPNPDQPEPTPRDTSRITYMGVGFGRNAPGDGQPFAIPRGNPFLNVHSINNETLAPGALGTGYIISKEGVHLGLTEANTRGFAFTNLEPGATHDEDIRDWAMVNMSFSMNGGEKHRGPGLIDTGVSQMYLGADPGIQIPNVTVPNPNPSGRAKYVQRVTPGTKLAVGFPSLGKRSIAEYSFSVGEGALLEPTAVIPAKRSRNFVNTGRNFLFGYSVAFDAIGGRFGFRRVKAPLLRR